MQLSISAMRKKPKTFPETGFCSTRSILVLCWLFNFLFCNYEKYVSDPNKP